MDAQTVTNQQPTPISLDHLMEEIHQPETSQDRIIQIIHDLGQISRAHGSLYYDCISRCKQTYPRINPLMGNVLVTIGNGWSTSGYYIYGLTYDGIRAVLQMKQLVVIVAETAEAVRSVFTNLIDGQRCAIITDSGAIKGRTTEYHALAVFLERKGNDLKMIIMDSLANHYCKQDVFSVIPKGLNLTLCISNVKRQEESTGTCNGFAIQDCKIFNTDSESTDALFDSCFEDGNIHDLPSGFMTLANRKKSINKVLKYHALIVHNNRLLG